MNAYSEDLRKKIVQALRRGMGKSQAARTFSVSLSSVKRYAKTAEEGRSLAPKKRPGSKPKLDERARRLLAADLEERPFLTLRQRCEYLRTVASVEVSRSTVCRAIKRMDATRKKGVDRPSRTRRVLEGRLEGDGGRGAGPREAGVRR
jgi:transposase